MSLEPTAPRPAPAFTADEERPITGRPFLVPLYIPHFTARSLLQSTRSPRLARSVRAGYRRHRSAQLGDRADARSGPPAWGHVGGGGVGGLFSRRRAGGVPHLPGAQ